MVWHFRSPLIEICNIVIHDVNHQEHQQRHADQLDGIFHLPVHGLAADCLDQQEKQASAVDGGNRKKVHDAEVCRQKDDQVEHIHPGHQGTFRLALLIGRADDIHDADRTGKIIDREPSRKELSQGTDGRLDPVIDFDKTVFQDSGGIRADPAEVAVEAEAYALAHDRRHFFLVGKAVAHESNGDRVARQRMFAQISAQGIRCRDRSPVDRSDDISGLYACIRQRGSFRNGGDFRLIGTGIVGNAHSVLLGDFRRKDKVDRLLSPPDRHRDPVIRLQRIEGNPG